jgi:hypothetical protein
MHPIGLLVIVGVCAWILWAFVSGFLAALVAIAGVGYVLATTFSGRP